MSGKNLYWGLLALVAVASSPAASFGGEDILEGQPWHHENITERALAGDQLFYSVLAGDGPRFEVIYDGAGFTAGAADSVAWHADFLDSYLYSPLWWAQGALGGLAGLIQRLKASLVGQVELAKLHFDDTFTSAGIRDNWERYADGTLIGLYWASLSGDVAAAHHILGVSVHAVQDFYSHSNWVDDPGRNCFTWLQIEPEERNSMSLYAGAYELPLAGAPAHHGAYSMLCSLVRGEVVDVVLDIVCAGLSPFQNTSLCEEWRFCSAATEVEIMAGGRLAENVVRLQPPGIALDTTWLTRAQAQNRGLVTPEGDFTPIIEGMYFPPEQCRAITGANADRDDVCTTDADLVFANAKDLAIRATTEWVQYIEEAMIAMGQGEFWARIKREGTDQQSREAQFEDFSKLGYQFLTAGPYPVANSTVLDIEAALNVAQTSSGWYLRLGVATASALFSGTNADIYAEVRGAFGTERVLLDYLPTTYQFGRTNNPLLVYNDFEAGDDDVYTIGPFAGRPEALRFVNESADAGDVLAALWTDFANAVDFTLTDTRRDLITFIAGKADYVGTASHFLTATEISEGLTATEGQPGGVAILYTLSVDGGIQGNHDFTYRLRPVPGILTEEERLAGWLGVEVQAWRLTTIDESTVDRFSLSDEPFIMFVVSPLNGLGDRSHAFMSDPIGGMNSLDHYVFPRTTSSAYTFKLPPGSGGVALSIRIFEHDEDTQEDRQFLLREFQAGFDRETLRPADRFEYELGRLLSPDWVAESVEVFAFLRGTIPEAGAVLTPTRLGTIEGGSQSEWLTLDWTSVFPLTSSDRAIAQWTAGPESLWGAGDNQVPAARCSLTTPNEYIRDDPGPAVPDGWNGGELQFEEFREALEGPLEAAPER